MRTFLYILPILLLSSAASGQLLMVQLDGEINFDGNSITIDEAGEDFTQPVESAAPFYVSVLSNNQLDKKINPSQSWQVYIQRETIEWDNALSLEVRRTGTGSRLDSNGNPQVQDGDNYQQINNTSNYFFSGRGEIVQIPLAFKISGISLTMGSRSFESSVIFTVYDN